MGRLVDSMTRPAGSRWLPGPDSPRMEEAQIHVWRASLDVEQGDAQALEAVLSAEERAATSRLELDWMKRRFGVRRGLLRTLLAAYLGAPPASLRFDRGPQGKPSLTGPPEWRALRFNASHSEDRALVAVAKGRDVGLDVERIRDGIEHAALAARYFSPAEASAIARGPTEQGTNLFFRYWTCKEAWVKARGGGLSIPLDRFEVKLEPGGRRGRVAAVEGTGDRPSWCVDSLDAAPGYAAALAFEEPRPTICLWDWTPRRMLEE